MVGAPPDASQASTERGDAAANDAHHPGAHPAGANTAAAEPSTSGGGGGGDSSDSGTAQCFVIVYNVAKRHNIGTLLRSCTAFGVTEVCVSVFVCARALGARPCVQKSLHQPHDKKTQKVCLVGARHFNTFGSHGSAEHCAMRHFPTLDAAVEYLRAERRAAIVGVEIDDAALPVTAQPFTGNTAFMLGNEVSMFCFSGGWGACACVLERGERWRECREREKLIPFSSPPHSRQRSPRRSFQKPFSPSKNQTHSKHTRPPTHTLS
jgi:hypothetical protein